MITFGINSTNININDQKGGDPMKDLICYIEQKDIFTVMEAARYLTVSPCTVYKLMHSGKLEYFKIGNQYKIKAAALNTFLASPQEES